MESIAHIPVRVSDARRDVARATDPLVPPFRGEGGAHFCLGARLARIETQLAMKFLVDKMPALRWADAAQLEWQALPPFRRLSHLKLLA